MTQTAPQAATENTSASRSVSVYVIEEHGRDYGATVAVYDDLSGALGHYGPQGPGALTPAQEWTPVKRNGEPTGTWTTRFESGNDGRILFIRKMPLTRVARSLGHEASA